MHSLLHRHLFRKHVAFLSADLSGMKSGDDWLTYCELMNVAIHTCEHLYVIILNEENNHIFINFENNF